MNQRSANSEQRAGVHIGLEPMTLEERRELYEAWYAQHKAPREQIEQAAHKWAAQRNHRARRRTRLARYAGGVAMSIPIGVIGVLLIATFGPISGLFYTGALLFAVIALIDWLLDPAPSVSLTPDS
jgi:hypothetical protein